MTKKQLAGYIFGATASVYGVLILISVIQLQQPRTYGEDLSGIGALILPVFAGIIALISLIIGTVINFIYRRVSPTPNPDVRWLILSIMFAVLSAMPLVYSGMATLTHR